MSLPVSRRLTKALVATVAVRGAASLALAHPRLRPTAAVLVRLLPPPGC
jgi:hypothetical protein